ncbi:MAG TPA: hypothetical protein DEO89_01785, partial [Lachnospiraceae bacterium]|nr:hypothetical protein [Lachnospiraceae bacterium]
KMLDHNTPSAAPTATPAALTPIRDVVKIENTTKDADGNIIVKEGTVLQADITGVNPQDSHDTLTYQWFTKDADGNLTEIPGAADPNYTLKAEDVDKTFVVRVTGNGQYTGSLDSDPFDAKRTDADISITQPTPAASKSPEANDKLTIVVNPTMEDYVYTLQKPDGTSVDPKTEMTVTDKDGKVLDPDEEGYYEQPAGGEIKFTELNKDQTYVIVKKKKDGTGSGTGGVVGPTVEDVTTKYDDKNTQDKKDDTIEIVVDPALKDSVYAIRKWEDGKWNDISVVKNSDGKWVPFESGNVWTDGGESNVTFGDLPASGTYKVVAKSKDGSVIKDITPGEVIGGSGDIKAEQPAATPSAVPTAAPSAVPSAAPSTGTTGNGNTAGTVTATPAPQTSSAPSYTKEVEKTASDFVKDHFTDEKGDIITRVTDLTRDKITSGEETWKKLSTTEKQAINQLIQQKGGKYTYEQLLKKAKAYKIPGFKVIKFMQKKSKAKLKLIKCKGAKIVCTSTNKKVATVDKKGVISAKKPGRAIVTFTAMKGKYTNRLVIDVRVKKKFKNAKELTKFKSNVIKTPTVLVAKKRLLKKSSRIDVYDLEKKSKVQYKPIKKKILTINKKGKYTGKKKGSTLVKVNIKQNGKTYLLYVYVTIY